MSMVYCRGCGKQIHESAVSCPQCGAPQKGVVREGELPEGVKGWSWGAFFLSWIWAIGNRTWIGLIALIPYVGFVMAIILGVKGREWAWKNKEWESVEHFQRVQRLWSIWGVAIVLGVGGVGILAAIAIPAYQDYTIRSKTAQAVMEAHTAATAVTDYVSKNSALPADVQSAGFEAQSAYIQSINIDERSGTLAVVMAGPPSSIDGKAFLFTPRQGKDGGISWTCSPGDLPAKYMPSACRN